MRTRFRRKAFHLIKINHHQPGEPRQREWIERIMFPNAGEISQSEGPQLVLFSFFGGRQTEVVHNYWLLVFGFRSLDFGFRSLVFGFGVDCAALSQNPRPKTYSVGERANLD